MEISDVAPFFVFLKQFSSNVLVNSDETQVEESSLIVIALGSMRGSRGQQSVV